MKALKLPVALLLFILAYGSVIFYYALTAPVMLDENLALSRIKRSPMQLTQPVDYWHAKDHPAVFHWIDRAVLHALNVRIGDVPKLDLKQGPEWNLEHRAAPRRPVMVLRCAGSAALVGALVCVFFIARTALGGYVWGFVAGALLALPPHLGMYVAGYIKTDAYLAFFMALAGLVWLRFHLSGRPAAPWRAAVMGVIIGLAVSTKLSGVFLLAAYAVYLALVARGAFRALAPAAAAVVAFAIFAAVNPIMWQGGPAWWLEVVRGVIAQRENVVSLHEDALFGKKGFLEILVFLFPLWYLLPAAALLAAQSQKQAWFTPVAVWSLGLIIGTVVTTTQPIHRYRMPLDFGLVVLAVLALGSVVERLRRGEMTMRELVK